MLLRQDNLASQQIRDIDKVFQSFFCPQTNSCESCKKMSEKYCRWFDGYIFRNEKPIKLLTFIYAFYSLVNRSVMWMLRHLLKTFSQNNSCEMYNRMAETYYRCFDMNIFKNDQPTKLIIF